MIIEQVWTGNAYRNFNYLIACPDTGEALAIDPLDAKRCVARAADRGWRITQLLNTHHHADHIGGNTAVVRETGAKILAHRDAARRIPNMDRGLVAGDTIKVGNLAPLRCLDTPGHTMSHICLLADGDPPLLFSGDTLFNAGAGNCHNGGHPEALFETFRDQLYRLPSATRLYPGHEYLTNNLRFTLAYEPDNADAARLLEKIDGQDPNDPYVTTLEEEARINTFFRLDTPTVIKSVVERFPEIGPTPDPKTVFMKLRELRNDW
ncbi:MAG: hydroxyacylglutathione hydrolase C-terminal domain-containing protein [Pseudomonadota bacterium]